MQECRHESEIYKYQQIQLSNNKFINIIWGVCLTWVDCKTEGPQLSCSLLLESLSSKRFWGHRHQEGCAWSGSSMAFVARKAKIKQWLVFDITWVMDVLLSCRVMDVLSVKCLHSWHSISNFRKIFVAEGLKGTRTFYLPHSYVNISSFTFIRQAWNATGYYLIV